ncbi:MAG TPA: GntR family transcriptional regulator [Hyphomicrobiaceae bacterium]|nr:GntR family transcriptional regulator [Hyphomicrobiaceae bacterium]
MLSGNRMIGPGRFSTRPLYLQVRDALASRIAGGEWKPNAAIPNEGDLAREFGVSSGTMRKALDLMEGERLLTRRQGRGTFVNDQASDELAVRYSNIRTVDGERITGEVNMLGMTQGSANATECARLRMRPDDRVWRIQRVRMHKGEPFMVEEVAMPVALFPGLDEQNDFSNRIVVLAQQYGILLGKGDERVSIGSASPAVAEALNLKASTPILVLDRVVQDLGGRPVEWRLGMGHFADKYYLAEIH